MIKTEEKTPMSRREDLIEAVILVQKHLETPTDIVNRPPRGRRPLVAALEEPVAIKLPAAQVRCTKYPHWSGPL